MPNLSRYLMGHPEVSTLRGLGFRVCGLGFGVWVLGFRVAPDSWKSASCDSHAKSSEDDVGCGFGNPCKSTPPPPAPPS